MPRPVAINVVTGPALEPVSLAEAKDHCRIDETDSDAHIGSLIRGAREHVENNTRLALITRTLDVAFDSFASFAELPQAPLQSITSIKYLDATGSEQTLDSSVYRVDSVRSPGRVTIAPDQTWPALYGVPSQVTMRIVAGFGAAAINVPQSLRSAILLHVQLNYDQDIKESALLKSAIKDLIGSYIIHYL